MQDPAPQNAATEAVQTPPDVGAPAAAWSAFESPIVWCSVVALVAMVVAPGVLTKRFIHRRIASLDQRIQAILLIYYIFVFIGTAWLAVRSIVRVDAAIRFDATGGEVHFSDGAETPAIVMAVITVITMVGVCWTMRAEAAQREREFDATLRVGASLIAGGSDGQAVTAFLRAVRAQFPEQATEVTRRLVGPSPKEWTDG